LSGQWGPFNFNRIITDERTSAALIQMQGVFVRGKKKVSLDIESRSAKKAKIMA
jgi:hypothetical protein